VQICQVLLNLLINAGDAVALSLSKWISLQVQSTDLETIEISVTDSGPGLAPQVRDRILSSSITTKPMGQGTGLGLNISQKIVRAHGSELKFDEQSSNTRFYFRLPLRKGTKETVPI